MSCSTLNNQVGLNVATANLPEGFCPSSMQELLQAFGARLIVTPNQSFNGFAIGSIEPASNVGPWFKDCLELFVFDDATARYIPMSVRGTYSNEQYFTANGNFTVPEFVYKLRVTAWGGGGGGSGQFGAGTSGNGGGGGAFAVQYFDVVPGQIIPFVVGMGGTAGVSVGGAGGTGGNTQFLTMTANGGTGGSGTVHVSAAGGTATGSLRAIQGGFGDGGAQEPGNGGASSLGGAGGVDSWGANPTSFNGIAPGGGGSGGIEASSGQQVDGGSGAGGAILIQY